MLSKVLTLFVASATALQLPQMPRVNAVEMARKLPAAALAASVTMTSELAYARTWTGVNGQLDFGPLAGDQPGGEGTGRALGINDDSLLIALGVVSIGIFALWSQWQTYQVRVRPLPGDPGPSAAGRHAAAARGVTAGHRRGAPGRCPPPRPRSPRPALLLRIPRPLFAYTPRPTTCPPPLPLAG